MLNNWVQGEGLQALIKTKTEAQIKADIGIGEVKWEGMKAYVGSLTARGYEDAAFSKLNINGVRIDFEGVKEQAFKIPYINVNQAKAVISDERLPGLYPVPEISENAGASNSKMPAWIKGRIPKRVEIGDIMIGSMSFEVLDEKGVIAMAIRESNASIKPNLDNGIVEIFAQKGRLQLPAPAPKLNIREASVRCNGNNIFINDASLEVYDGGHVGGLGEIEIGDVPKVDLDLNVSNIDIKNVLTGIWKTRVKGTVRGPVKVTGPVDNLVQKGTLHLEDGVLESIPGSRQNRSIHQKASISAPRIEPGTGGFYSHRRSY